MRGSFRRARPRVRRIRTADTGGNRQQRSGASTSAGRRAGRGAARCGARTPPRCHRRWRSGSGRSRAPLQQPAGEARRRGACRASRPARRASELTSERDERRFGALDRLRAGGQHAVEALGAPAALRASARRAAIARSRAPRAAPARCRWRRRRPRGRCARRARAGSSCRRRASPRRMTASSRR